MKILPIRLAVVLLGALMLAGCKSSRDVAYFQNIEDVDLSLSKGLYTARIMPKDELTITVSSTDPTAASVFNLSVSKTISNSSTSLSTQQILVPYVVDNDGYINYPQIGRLYVVGMSCVELQEYICKKIAPYFSNDDPPLVTVRMSNYRVTVLGEVSSPRVVSVSEEKMSVLEAIASAGDLSIYGQRKNVIVIREDENGEKSYHMLDLTDANVINDPYYYVQQNDIIYVTPNKTKARNSDIGQVTTITISITSILISLASLMYNILKK
ncbi:MAG: polysaccharide biosynthesis/export family protein [Prevotella sp.]|nr:polysaccharide biosynthesis/export family protein [Prevotella sp.]